MSFCGFGISVLDILKVNWNLSCHKRKKLRKIHHKTQKCVSFIECNLESSAYKLQLASNGFSRILLLFSVCGLRCRIYISVHHKELTYIEYRAVSGVFGTIDPPPPLHPSSVSSPPPKARSPGGDGLGGGGGGGSIFWKMPDIGLASYSIVPLRCSPKENSLHRKWAYQL